MYPTARPEDSGNQHAGIANLAWWVRSTVTKKGSISTEFIDPKAAQLNARKSHLLVHVKEFKDKHGKSSSKPPPSGFSSLVVSSPWHSSASLGRLPPPEQSWLPNSPLGTKSCGSRNPRGRYSRVKVVQAADRGSCLLRFSCCQKQLPKEMTLKRHPPCFKGHSAIICYNQLAESSGAIAHRPLELCDRNASLNLRFSSCTLSPGSGISNILGDFDSFIMCTQKNNISR